MKCFIGGVQRKTANEKFAKLFGFELSSSSSSFIIVATICDRSDCTAATNLVLCLKNKEH